jgi:hypothetical protein
MPNPIARLTQRPVTLPARTLAEGLGWLSLVLGAAEVIAPRKLSGSLARQAHGPLVGGFGLREIAAGLGILLSRKDPTPWIWGRLIGDVADLATLAGALGRDNPRRGRAAAAFALVASVTALDLICAKALRDAARPRKAPERDYSTRSGMPRSPGEMRGVARRPLSHAAS